MFWLVGISFLISFFLTPGLIKGSQKLKLFDQPKTGKIHISPTPRLGGMALYFSFFIPVLILLFFFKNLNLKQFFWIWLSATIFFGAGVLDDFLNIPPKLKLWLITLGGGVLIFAYPLNNFPWWVRIISYLIMILWVDYLSNAFNLLDGMDGLCSGIAMVAAFFFFWLAIYVGRQLPAFLCLILIGGLLGFIKYNLPQAKIFLGDSGSYLIGGLLAIIVVGILETVSLKIIPILWILAVPVIDTSTVLLRRVFLKGDLLQGDLMHSYNLLLGRFKNTGAVLFLLFTEAVIFGAVGLALFFAPKWLVSGTLIIPVFLLFYFIKFSPYFKK